MCTNRIKILACILNTQREFLSVEVNVIAFLQIVHYFLRKTERIEVPGGLFEIQWED